jgi:hypothetical protein
MDTVHAAPCMERKLLLRYVQHLRRHPLKKVIPDMHGRFSTTYAKEAPRDKIYAVLSINCKLSLRYGMWSIIFGKKAIPHTRYMQWHICYLWYITHGMLRYVWNRKLLRRCTACHAIYENKYSSK